MDGDSLRGLSSPETRKRGTDRESTGWNKDGDMKTADMKWNWRQRTIASSNIGVILSLR